jgi:hypothetical protein
MAAAGLWGRGSTGAQVNSLRAGRQAALRSQAQTTAVGLNVQRGPIGRAVRRKPRHGGRQRSGNQDHGHQDGADRHRSPPDLKPAHDRSLAAARASRQSRSASARW